MATPTLVEELHAASEIKKVPLAKLRPDMSYQREFSQTLVDEIANNWDLVASELLLVSDRGPRTGDDDVEGGLKIVNGQHRTNAAIKLGIRELDARVINLRDAQKFPDPGKVEAQFRLKTNVKLGDRPLERFKAQLRAGDPESAAIVKLLARFGAEINTQPQETGINCVATIEALYRADETGALLAETLEVVRDTWDHVGGKNAQSSILKGIFWFVAKHSSESDRGRLVTKLKGIGITNLHGRARQTGLTMGGSLWINVYRSIVELYNEGLRERNRLQWMLRGKAVLTQKGGANEATI